MNEITYHIVELNIGGPIDYFLLDSVKDWDQINKNRKHIVFSTTNESEAFLTLRDVYNC